MKRVIISGGGTGGHIFPAIAIANALKMKVKDIEILFIGAKGRMEMIKVPAAGYPIEGLNISGFQRRLTWKNLTFPFKLAGSLIKARSILNKFNPDVVIGVGGYASGPTLRIATSMHIPSLIQEQNSFPGVTNRLLGNRVQKICVAYEGMEKFFPADRILLTGNPIRQDVMNINGKRDEAMQFFGLSGERKTILVIGGSLGAGTINQAMMKFAGESFADKNLQVLWQTGKYYYESVTANLKNAEGNSLVVLPFIDRMDLAYAAADIIVSRAGAIAISELCVIGKPVILIPSPNVAEDHQTKNARALESRKAAVLVPDSEAIDRLGDVIISVLEDDAIQSELKKSIATLGITDAADRIAGAALSLIPNNELPQASEGLSGLGSIYFLGIGGIGMSALARYFSSKGARVSGYDKTPTALTGQLVAEGMNIHYQEDLSLLPADPDLVIYTPAIPAGHLEYRYFQDQAIRMKKRAEVLGMISRNHKTIAVAGTHGKTTTSTMIAHLLATAGVEMLAFLGGISNNYATNFLARSQNGKIPGSKNPCCNGSYCVVEADEFDKSFLQLNPCIAVITSADADHLDIYGNFDDMKQSFSDFTSKIVKGGSLVIKSGIGITAAEGDYAVFDYNLSSGSAFSAVNVKVEEGLYRFDFVHPAGKINELVLGVPGRFNLENAIAALAVGHLLGLDENHMREALLTYNGVRRRFEFRIRRPGMVYIDDYAHHPEELRACISAARELYPSKKLTGVFQPHLFSRTRDFADGFARSLELLDELILLDIYPAREKPIEGVTSQMLLDRINLPKKRLVSKDDLLREIMNYSPEILLTMGAGDIDQFAEPITELLTANPAR